MVVRFCFQNPIDNPSRFHYLLSIGLESLLDEIMKLVHTILAANENPSVANEMPDMLGFAFANEYSTKSKDNWVQLSPFGKFPNVAGLQVFTHADAREIANEFDSTPSAGVKYLGLPWYIGHPDHPGFKDQYKDTKAYGRIKELEVRHAANCAKCNSFFANEDDAKPCREHGLFANVRWSDEGKQLIANENYHGHSTNWRMKKVGGEWHPFSLKSVGFTNEPGIPVPAITTANQKTVMAKSKTSLMGYVAQLLKKPELAVDGANEDDAVSAMNEYAANAAKAMTDLEAERNAHATTKQTHQNLVNTMAGLTKCYGANEELAPVIEKLKTDLKLEVPAEGQVAFFANEITTRAAAVATKETELQAANQKVTELTTRATNAETLAANQRKEFATNLSTMLVTGGFCTKAEADAMAKDKDFANEDQFKTFVTAASALKPKINVVGQFGNLGHMSADVQAANQKTVAKTDAIVTAVNEYQDLQQQKTGKRPDYITAFGHIEKTRKDLFTTSDETITR